MNEPINIHTDGACTGNPGPGGFAAILVSEEIDFHDTVTGGDPATTNNRMELSAVIEAIRLVNSSTRVPAQPPHNTLGLPVRHQRLQPKVDRGMAEQQLAHLQEKARPQPGPVALAP